MKTEQAPDIWRCLVCASEFDGEKLPPETSACPECGAVNSPIRPAEAVDIKITWHELRILTIWAERWASQHAKEHPDMPKVVRTIAAFAGAQHPGKPSLTFLGEIEGLRERLGAQSVQQNVVVEKNTPPEGSESTDHT